MSINVPNLPVKFDWTEIRAILIQWFGQLQNAQVFVPPGTIAIFVNTTAPAGWLLCDGSIYEKVKYRELAKAIGTEVTPTTFAVPNLGAPPVGSKWIIKV